MASIVSKMGICNLAMGWLRANLITNFDTDTSVEAKLCRANYDRLREAVLEAKEWRFATRRLALTPSATPPVYGWTHKFSLPPDCIRVLSVSGSAAASNNKMDNNIDWEREEDFVFANTAVVYIRYTSNIDIPTKFSPGFVQTFATLIAAELAVPLTGSAKKQEKFENAYLVKLSGSATRDGMQGKARKRRPGRLEKARYQGGGGFDTVADV